MRAINANYAFNYDNLSLSLKIDERKEKYRLMNSIEIGNDPKYQIHVHVWWMDKRALTHFTHRFAYMVICIYAMFAVNSSRCDGILCGSVIHEQCVGCW